MCGFSGILKIKDRNDIDLKKTVSAMCDRLVHRGPDDKGLWIDEQNTIALAHQRLAIIDLSLAGHQPMISKCGRYVLVFNGEIYNHKSIRNELENDILFKNENYSWEGQSDTEILLTAITIWGFAKTLERIVGMFAIACWDLNQNTLFLTRDRIGEKPLYYGVKNNLLVFASELDAFEEVKDFPLDINREIIPFYLKRSFIPAPFSIYKGIHKLIPGTYLEINMDQKNEVSNLKPIQYWNLKDQLVKSQKNKLNKSDKSLINNIDFLIKDSIKNKMVADVPIGAFLSGGLDSSIVVSIMQSLSSNKIKTYTLGFQESEYDESHYAKKIAKFLGTDHKEFILKPSEVIKVVTRLTDIYDEPFADISQIPMVLISELASKEVKVCLSGDGGDEIFAGYNRYIFGANSWRIIKCFPLQLRIFISEFILSISLEKLKRIFILPSLFFPNILRLNIIDEKIYKFANLITARNSSEIYHKIFHQGANFNNIVKGVSKNQNEFISTNDEDINLNTVHKMILEDMRCYLPDDILVKVDRATMYSSLETRLPLLDHRLINYVFRVPTEKKIRFFKGKWILRKLLNKYIPEKLYDRPKKGFSVPMAEWLRGPLREWAEDLIDSKRIEKDGFFNPFLVEKKWKEHLSGKKNWSSLLWNILIFQLWLNKINNS
tara:strand:- start:54 stop:2036 length:1983 start_codon:yes stop_codon:yes gene_type:complete